MSAWRAQARESAFTPGSRRRRRSAMWRGSPGCRRRRSRASSTGRKPCASACATACSARSPSSVMCRMARRGPSPRAARRPSAPSCRRSTTRSSRHASMPCGAGYVLLLASTEYDRARERSEVAALLERGVDGVMLVGGDHDPAVYRLLAGKRVPFVNTWVYETASGRPCVGFDNRRAAMRMTDYLLDLGHRRFAVIAGVTLHNDRAAERVLGVQAALAARGIALTPAQIIERPSALAEGRDALRLLMRQKEPPTAIICGNDVLAIGALLECLAANIAVPGEISIAGFDDLELASHIQPGLTTLRVPSAGMGRRAAEYLVSRLVGRTVPDCVELDVELIVRGTTAPPP